MKELKELVDKYYGLNYRDKPNFNGGSLHICRGNTWCINGIDPNQLWLMERIHDSSQGADYSFVKYLSLEEVEFLENNYHPLLVSPRSDYFCDG